LRTEEIKLVKLPIQERRIWKVIQTNRTMLAFTGVVFAEMMAMDRRSIRDSGRMVCDMGVENVSGLMEIIMMAIGKPI